MSTSPQTRVHTVAITETTPRRVVHPPSLWRPMLLATFMLLFASAVVFVLLWMRGAF